MTESRKSLDDLVAHPPPDRPHKSTVGKSLRSKIAANLDKIEAARRNGWRLDDIARAIGIDCAAPGARLAAYLSSIKKSAARRSRLDERGGL